MALPYNQRTCLNNEVTRDYLDQSVTLVGWVDNYRDHGGMVFIDLRDHSGLVQLRFNPDTDPKAHELAGSLRSEDCICVRGDVALRPDNMANPNLATGEIEVQGHEIEVLSRSETPPFELEDEIKTNEELRLKYRYLDMRRRPMQHNLRMRHRITKTIRDVLDRERFIEVETPTLTRSTPEGARDFLVPSRVTPGAFYALPQSPQLFKQLLMIGGYDRYMQIARCFRDEDLRADRQPEFTQLDIEMAFVQPPDVMAIAEKVLSAIMQDMHGVTVPTPFPHMSYADALRDYGIDRPDTRYDLKIQDCTEVAKSMDFRVFSSAIEAGGVVRALCLKGGASFPRKGLDALTEELKGIGAGGMPLVKVNETDGKPGFETGIAKFFTEPAIADMCSTVGAEPGDLILFSADSEANVCKYLSWLRETLAERQGLIPEDTWNFLWVVEFPMFEWSEEDGRYYAMHHPFTAPLDEDIDTLAADPGKARAKAYDVVLNGTELGGGSIRIHQAAVQQQVFDILKIGPEEQKGKFGFLMEALKYGPPPHGGLAFGLDRIVMLMLGLDSLRDTISFPKNQRAFCPMTEAPSKVAVEQLEELFIRSTAPTE